MNVNLTGLNLAEIPSYQLSTMALTNPTPEDALKLFKDIEQKFPSANLGEDKWEILAVLALFTSTS